LNPNIGFEGTLVTASVKVFNDGPAAASNFTIGASWKPAEDPGVAPIPLTGYTVDGILASGASTILTWSIQVPSNALPGLYAITVCVDPENRIFERSETNNCNSNLLFRVEGRRDYEITDIVPASPTVFPGQQSSLTFTARNNGFRFDAGTNAHAVWSDDDRITALDPELSMTDFGHLFPNETASTWTVALSMPVPFSALPGVHYVGVCADWFERVEETDETNNCRLVPITVVDKPPSNSFPVVERVAMDAVTGLPGDHVRLTFRVANPGNLETLPFELRIFVMANAPVLCGAGCTKEQVLARTEQGIPARGSRLYSAVSVEIPQWAVPIKDYFVAVYATSQVRETLTFSESIGLGAFRSSSLPLAENLVVDPFGPSLPTVSPGLSISVFASIRSHGTGFFYQSTRTSIRWSRDNVLDASDPEVAGAVMTETLDTFLDRGRIVSLRVPANAAPGTNYVFTCLDSTDFVFETDEANCFSAPVTVQPALSGYKDLVVEGLALSGGPAVQVTFSVRNTGTSPISVSQPWYNYIRWSTDSRIDSNDPQLAMFSMDSLGAGAARTFTKSVQVPQGVNAGTYFIGICADAFPTFNSVGELDEANNCSSIPFNLSSSVHADLSVSNVSTQTATVRPGGPVWVSFTVANSGNVEAASFLNSITWNPNGIASPDSLWFRQFGWGGLAENSTLDVGPIRVDVPANAAVGTYLVGVCLDSEQRIVEADEGNNCGYVPIHVEGTVGPGQWLRMSMPAWGSAVTSTGGDGVALTSGFAHVELHTGTMAYGAAVLSVRSNGITVSEAGIPSSPPAKGVSLFVELQRAFGVDINTGVAIANPGPLRANMNVSLRGPDGTLLVSGAMSLESLGHVARFVSDLANLIPGFVIPAGFSVGSLEIASDQPVSVMALKLLWNQRGETVMTSIPVVNISRPPVSEPVSIPLFADGGGFTTTLVLKNMSSVPQLGQLHFRGRDGSSTSVQLTNGQSGGLIPYVIPGNGIGLFMTDGAPGQTRIGSVESVPTGGAMLPEVIATYRLTQNGVIVSESSVPATPKSTAFRLFADVSGGHDTGIAISNPWDFPVTVTERLNSLSNQSIAQTTFTLPARGMISRFVTDTFTSVPSSFRGQVTVDSSYPLHVLNIRGFRNERGEFLMATLPAVDSWAPAPPELVFPQIVDGGGWKTEIILINADRYTESSSIIRLVPDTGTTFSLPLQ